MEQVNKSISEIDGWTDMFRHLVTILGALSLFSGASNLEELYQTLTDHIMIRRLKSEVFH